MVPAGPAISYSVAAQNSPSNIEFVFVCIEQLHSMLDLVTFIGSR